MICGFGGGVVWLRLVMLKVRIVEVCGYSGARSYGFYYSVFYVNSMWVWRWDCV